MLSAASDGKLFLFSGDAMLFNLAHNKIGADGFVTVNTVQYFSKQVGNGQYFDLAAFLFQWNGIGNDQFGHL